MLDSCEGVSFIKGLDIETKEYLNDLLILNKTIMRSALELIEKVTPDMRAKDIATQALKCRQCDKRKGHKGSCSWNTSHTKQNATVATSLSEF